MITCLSVPQLRHVVEMTEDGDETVVSASVAVMQDSPIYYVNLAEYNRDKNLNRKHANLTEVSAIQDLVLSLLATSTPSLPNYVTTSLPPSTDAGKRLRLRVLSPVSLDAYDSAGNHTGMAPNPIPGSDLLFKEEEIPNSYYEEFGDGKYLGLPAGSEYVIELKGLGLGTFTLEITQVENGAETPPTPFADIPVSSTTIATLDINASGEPGSLALDQDGDGTVDAVIGGSGNVMDLQAYAQLVLMSVRSMDLGIATKVTITGKLSVVIGLLPTAQYTKRTILRLLDDIEKYVQQQLKRSSATRSPYASIADAYPLNRLQLFSTC